METEDLQLNRARWDFGSYAPIRNPLYEVTHSPPGFVRRETNMGPAFAVVLVFLGCSCNVVSLELLVRSVTKDWQRTHDDFAS